MAWAAPAASRRRTLPGPLQRGAPLPALSSSMACPSHERVPDWLTPKPSGDAMTRRGRRLVWLLLLGFAAVTWFGVPHGIGSSWRECDTQAIARNFLLDGFDPLRPRVDWRGDTDGAVECEFPLYQMAIAGVLAAIGDVHAEWPGRLLALLSLLVGALALHRLLEWRSGPLGALAGTVVFLCSGSASLLATRVMPDATSLAFTAIAMLAFTRQLGSGSPAALLVAVASLALAGLQKPLALQVGIVWFGWAALLVKRRLLDPRLWLGFAATMGIVTVWLVHGAHIHAETNLTFGVVSGGDTKFPDLPHLVSIPTWVELLRTTATFGCSVFGMLAFVVLALRRRLDRADVVLVLAVALGLFVSLRYSHTRDLGPHYHSCSAIAGAWLVARAWPANAGRWAWLALLGAAALHGAWRLRDERGMRIEVNRAPIVADARAASGAIAPGERVVVRSEKTYEDHAWHRPQNFEDPRFFFLTNTHGWVLANDAFDVVHLAQLRSAGADFVYDQTPETTDPAVTRWLAEHGEVVVQGEGGIVHRLHARR